MRKLKSIAAGPVTPAQRRLAIEMDRDQQRWQKMGVQEAATLSWRACQAVLASYRNGKRKLAPVLRRELWKGIPTLAQGMLGCYLAGYARAHEHADIKLSAQSDALYFMQKRLDLTPAELKRMQAKFNTNAIYAYHKASRLAEKKLERALLEATQEGLHVRQGSMRLHAAFEAAGIMPGSSYMVENLVRSQTALAYSAGQQYALQQPAIDSILKALVYTTVGDDRVRPSHQLLEGVTLAKDDPFWETSTPPNGWSCFVEGTEVLPKDLLWVSKARYTGEVVVVETCHGYRLTVTPNHPIATMCGWKSAGQLNESDYLFSRSSDVKLSRSTIRADKQQCPTKIENLFYSGSAFTKATSSLDFHGDAAAFDESKIDVVLINGEEVQQLKIGQAENFVGKGLLTVGNLVLSFVNRLRSLSEFLRCFGDAELGSTNCFIPLLEGFGIGPNLAPSYSRALNVSSGFNTLTPKEITDCHKRHAINVFEVLQAVARVVQLNQLFGVCWSPPSSGLVSTSIFQSGADCGVGNTVQPSQSVWVLSGLVTPDKISNIKRHFYVGHVYDLQSRDGCIIADSVLASNCRCKAIPIFSDDWEEVRPPEGPQEVEVESVDRKGNLITKTVTATAEPDEGWDFSPGELFSDVLAPEEAEEEQGEEWKEKAAEKYATVYSEDELMEMVQELDDEDKEALADILGLDVEDLEAGDLDLDDLRG